MNHFENLGIIVNESDARGCLGSLGLGGRLADRTPIKALSGGQKVGLTAVLVICH
jgi:ATP-binding cassette subfamily F protein 3